jgi:hypothetical protein
MAYHYDARPHKFTGPAGGALSSRLNDFEFVFSCGVAHPCGFGLCKGGSFLSSFPYPNFKSPIRNPLSHNDLYLSLDNNLKSAIICLLL